MSLKGKTLFISGASRGIGLAIALRAARDGANVAVAAKTAEPHPKLPGTIYTAAKEIEDAGGKALPIVCDIRNDDQVAEAVEQTVAKFGGIDICVNNASAIQLTPVTATDMRRYDLMQQINARGTFMVSKFAIPYLTRRENPHILMLSPPLDMAEKWFAPHTAYSMAKFGMSLVVLGLAGELRGKVAVNALWPRTTIATAAIKNLLGGDAMMQAAQWYGAEFAVEIARGAQPAVADRVQPIGGAKAERAAHVAMQPRAGKQPGRVVSGRGFERVDHHRHCLRVRDVDDRDIVGRRGRGQAAVIRRAGQGQREPWRPCRAEPGQDGSRVLRCGHLLVTMSEYQITLRYASATDAEPEHALGIGTRPFR